MYMKEDMNNALTFEFDDFYEKNEVISKNYFPKILSTLTEFITYKIGQF